MCCAPGLFRLPPGSRNHKALLGHFGGVTIDFLQRQATKALMAVRGEGHVQVVGFLQDGGANPDLLNRNGVSARSILEDCACWCCVCTGSYRCHVWPCCYRRCIVVDSWWHEDRNWQLKRKVLLIFNLICLCQGEKECTKRLPARTSIQAANRSDYLSCCK